MNESTIESIYDFPKYYDLLFGSDWKAEFDFLEKCFERYANRTVRRIFEPACGTGRLLIKLAKAGYEVSGNDLNPKAVEFCNARFKRHGQPETAFVGDMSDFTIERKADASFNTINSFRHLPTETAATAHLQCMARALAKGGLYALGIHLLPTDCEPMGEESWSARRGNLVINSHMWSKKIVAKERMEYLGMTIDVYTPTQHRKITDEMLYRTYTHRQFLSLLRKVPEFEIAAVHDFAYEIGHQVKIGPTTEDVVFILRRL